MSLFKKYKLMRFACVSLLCNCYKGKFQSLAWDQCYKAFNSVMYEFL
jgi:hypothetical protein